jgi:hypothetical protein
MRASLLQALFLADHAESRYALRHYGLRAAQRSRLAAPLRLA